MFEHDIGLLQEGRETVIYGQVSRVSEAALEVSGFGNAVAIGDRIRVGAPQRWVPGEVVGAEKGSVKAMLHDSSEGIATGQKVERVRAPVLHPSDDWIGRTLDARGEPIDGGARPSAGEVAQSLRARPPKPGVRRPMGKRIETGLRVFDTFLPICRGQRMGIFAGSGVGKSTLLGMLAKNVQDIDIVVVGLVGERGREVREFVENVMGPEGMRRTIVIAETSDAAPLAQRDAAYTATAVAESYRDAGYEVLLLMDSVTRFAAAQRRIGLTEEPPTVRAYPPSVFSRLSGLVERAGPGAGRAGDITAIYTVLVEGDDQNEPISDNVRALIDGHVVLDRSIAERGRFPAIDVLRSVSRALPDCHGDAENDLLRQARRSISVAADMDELNRIGAYRRGTDPETDAALDVNKALERFFAQSASETDTIQGSFERLERILEDPSVELEGET